MTQKEYLALIDDVIEKGRYKADWDSLSGHKAPDWFVRDKLGIFIHWGIYSVPGYGNEWYARSMYDKNCREFEHHRKTYGEHKNFGYKDFIPMFKAEKFNADDWAELFKKAGIRYVMPVAEHHDGFAMYDTEFNRWNAKNMGPCVDVVGELKKSCEKKGLTFCASTHRAEHYFFLNLGRSFDSDVNDEAFADFYGPAVYIPEFDSRTMGKTTEDPHALGASKEWLCDWLVRTAELIDKYQPSVIYFDWWIQNHSFKPYLKKLAAYYYNRSEEWGKEVTINYKHFAFPDTVATYDIEKGALTQISPVPWQTDTNIGKHSWGYIKDNKYKSTRQVVTDLIDIVSKNGNLLINIGPKPDGTITADETKVLLEMGEWLKLNGEGIYGTSVWRTFGEGKVNAEEGAFKDSDEKTFTNKDFRFTYKKGNLYVFQMRPNGKNAKIKTLRKREMRDVLTGKIELLGYGEVSYTRNEKEMEIKVPKDIDTALPLCFRIELL